MDDNIDSGRWCRVALKALFPLWDFKPEVEAFTFRSTSIGVAFAQFLISKWRISVGSNPRFSSHNHSQLEAVKAFL